MSSFTPEPIKRRRLYQDVMERILAVVKETGLQPGDLLPSERELMNLYKVGRPAVREALQNLARIGLISLNPGERASVAAPNFTNLMQTVSLTTSGILRNSDRSLEELKEARLIFEIQMVRLAAERATKENIERLEDRHAAHVASLSDLSQFMHHDMLFHREIAQMTGNSIFPVLSEALISWLGEFYQHLVRIIGAEELTLTEHAAILEGIKRRDADMAEQALRAHLTRANSLYRRLTEGER
ncbi:MAG: transcriptional regulator NanR [Aestuariivirga sp.]|nr:transcriptional regulator NanR [Aestuariivirga sp.]